MAVRKKKNGGDSAESTPDAPAAPAAPAISVIPPVTDIPPVPVAATLHTAGSAVAEPGKVVVEPTPAKAAVRWRSWLWSKLNVRLWPVDRWIALVSVIITVVAAWWGIAASSKEPRLTFAVSSVRTKLERQDFGSDLGFTYKGKPIEYPTVTAIRIAIWNDGTQSIKAADVLEPVQFTAESGAKLDTPVGNFSVAEGEILSVRVIKISRDVCQFSVVEDAKDFKLGHCRFNWRILEPGDGAVIQVIYAGAVKKELKLAGTIEGQRKIAEVEYGEPPEVRSRLDRPASYPRSQAMGYVTIGVLLICTLSIGYAMARWPKLNPGFLILGLIPVACLLYALLWLVSPWVAPSPPFGW